jgi:hypothetical protein
VATHVPLQDVLSGTKVKGSHPITWTLELLKTFQECKTSFSRATLLGHPDPSAPLAIITDASTSTMDAMLQQHIKIAWQSLAFFSRKLNPPQQKYSTYDCELAAIYDTVKHFRHILEASHRPVHDRHQAHIWTGQHCRQRLL